jgi:hypothetical protein
MFKEGGILSRIERRRSDVADRYAVAKDFLDAFPYLELQNLFKEELRRAQGDITKADSVLRRNFFVGNERKMRRSGQWGYYDYKRCVISPEINDDADRFATTIHEALHFVGDNRRHFERSETLRDVGRSLISMGPFLIAFPSWIINPTQGGFVGVVGGLSVVAGWTVSQVVLDMIKSRKGLHHNLGFNGKFGGELLDEGMTRLLENELTPKLLRRVGKSGLARKFESESGHFFLHNPRTNFNQQYMLGQLLVTALIGTISKKTDVPIADVYAGFKRQYLTTGFDVDVKLLIEELVGSGAMKQLAELGINSSDEDVYRVLYQFLDKWIKVQDQIWSISKFPTDVSWWDQAQNHYK